jgi:hypothetical protein
VPSHELQPLGTPPTKDLDLATWAAQSLVVALVLGGVALIAYAIKRRQIARRGGAGTLGLGGADAMRGEIRPRIMRDAEREDDEADGPRDGAQASQGFAYVGMGATSALRDEVASLRAEIESTRDEAAELRREVAGLRAIIERGGIERAGISRGTTRGERHGPEDVPGEAAQRTGVPSAFGDARIEIKPAAAARPEVRETVEQRVLAMAARGESVISIAQRTGVPTGQVELMLNLARASGRV